MPDWYALREGSHGRPGIEGWQGEGGESHAGGTQRGGTAGGAESVAQAESVIHGGDVLSAGGESGDNHPRGYEGLWDSITHGRGDDMECQFAFICDFAEQDRKLHAVGIGWDSMFVPQLPYSHPSMSVVARVRGSIAEAGTKTITLRLIDADGTDVMPPLEQQTPLEVKPPAVEGALNLVFNLIGMQLSKYGSYAFHLLVNGNELQRLPFSVVKPPTTA